MMDFLLDDEMDSANGERGGERRAGRSKKSEEAMVAGEMVGRDGEIDGEVVEMGGEMEGEWTDPMGSDMVGWNAMAVTLEWSELG